MPIAVSNRPAPYSVVNDRTDTPIFETGGKASGIRWTLQVYEDEIIIRNIQGSLVSKIWRDQPYDHTVRLAFKDTDFVEVCQDIRSQGWEKVQFENAGIYVGRWLSGYTGGWQNIIHAYPHNQEFRVFASPTKDWKKFIKAIS